MKKIVILVLGLVLISAGAFALFREKNGFQTVEVTRRNLLQEVEITGTVSPTESAELGFEQTGRIADIKVQEGDMVTQGQELIVLDQQSIRAQLAQARARLQSQQAESVRISASIQNQSSLLEELEAGTRTEEIDIARSERDLREQQLLDQQALLIKAQELAEKQQTQREKALEDANNNLNAITAQTSSELLALYEDIPTQLNEASIAASKAIKTDLDKLFNSTNYNTHTLVYDGYDQAKESSIENGRAAAFNSLKNLETVRDQADALPVDQQMNSLDSAISILKSIRSFLLATSDYVNGPLLDDENSIDSNRSSVNTAKESLNQSIESLETLSQSIRNQSTGNLTQLSSAQKAVNDAEQALEVTISQNEQSILSAQASVNQAEEAVRKALEELKLKEAGTRSETIKAQQARVNQERAGLSVQYGRIQEARAEIERINAELEKTILRAPIDGMVTQVFPERGEIVGPNQNMLDMISTENFEIEARVPEINIAKLQEGQSASITLDAFGDEEVFEASITRINAAETLVDGVPNYEVTLQFKEKDERIRSGMTANISISVAEKPDTLSLPVYAIYEDREGYFVEIPSDRFDQALIQRIESKFLSSDGYRSVDEGLVEGQEVIIPGNN